VACDMTPAASRTAFPYGCQSSPHLMPTPAGPMVERSGLGTHGRFGATMASSVSDAVEPAESPLPPSAGPHHHLRYRHEPYGARGWIAAPEWPR